MTKYEYNFLCTAAEGTEGDVMDSFMERLSEWAKSGWEAFDVAKDTVFLRRAYAEN